MDPTSAHSQRTRVTRLYSAGEKIFGLKKRKKGNNSHMAQSGNTTHTRWSPNCIERVLAASSGKAVLRSPTHTISPATYDLEHGSAHSCRTSGNHSTKKTKR